MGTKKPRKNGLLPQQERFLTEYMKNGFNGQKAAMAAGYSKKTATVQASRLLTHPKVAQELERRLSRQVKMADIDAARVLKELERLGLADVRGAFDEAGNLRPVHELPEDLARAVAGVEVVKRPTGDKENPVEYLHKLRFWDKNTALTNLAKHFGMLRELVEHSGKVKVETEEFKGVTTAELKRRLQEAVNSL